MKRIHLFEIEDLPWCPNIIREAITDFLRGLYRILPILDPAYEKILEVLDKTGDTAIVDCCSGSGGPTEQLRAHLDKHQKASVSITLTDKYPNLKLFEYLENKYQKRLTGHKQSIDAQQFPPDLKGLRTFFSSFHHFAPNQARKILQDAVNNGASIAIFETTQRHVADFIRALISPILMWLIIPISKRLTWPKFLLTYIIPITPLAFMWDYLVSNLRTYSVKELHGLINEIQAPHYTWQIGKLKSKKAKSTVIYLVGYKNDK